MRVGERREREREREREMKIDRWIEKVGGCQQL